MKSKNVITIAVFAAIAILTSCGGSKKDGLPNFSDDEFAVSTISTSSAALQTTYPATIKGIQDVEVRPKVSGFITKVFVHEGQTVSAGQPLFSIDSETYQAAVRQCQAAVNTAKAQANTAKLTYKNNKNLFDSHIIGEYELSTAANTLATAEAQVAQAEAALASAREQLAWCVVKSPSAGVVGSLPFKEGALVSASGQALTTVSNISTMEVFFSISESELLNMGKNNGNMQAAIEKSRHVHPVNLIFALCIPLIGTDAGKKIVNTIGFDGFADRMRNATDFVDIDGIGQEKSGSILEWYANPKNSAMFEALIKELDIEQVDIKDMSEGSLNGKTFVITGDVHDFANRSEFKAYVESQGGKVTGSVSKKTDYLVNNDTESTSSKNKKAKELGIPIISEDTFIEMFGR